MDKEERNRVYKLFKELDIENQVVVWRNRRNGTTEYQLTSYIDVKDLDDNDIEIHIHMQCVFCPSNFPNEIEKYKTDNFQPNYEGWEINVIDKKEIPEIIRKITLAIIEDGN